jgi:hypothetical protein
MFVGIGMAIVCLMIFIVKLPSWTKKDKIEQCNMLYLGSLKSITNLAEKINNIKEWKIIAA